MACCQAAAALIWNGLNKPQGGGKTPAAPCSQVLISSRYFG
jgi:hypothetical protein